MYYELDNKGIELINKISEITHTTYDKDQNYISVDSMLYALEEMKDHYEHLEEEYNNFKQNVEDNYKPISYAEQVGISERDFI